MGGTIDRTVYVLAWSNPFPVLVVAYQELIRERSRNRHSVSSIIDGRLPFQEKPVKTLWWITSWISKNSVQRTMVVAQVQLLHKRCGVSLVTRNYGAS